MAIILLMRKTLVVFILLIALLLLFAGCQQDKPTNSDYLRLHIRANSNATFDQEIKLFIRDEVIKYLSPYFENVTTSKEAETVVKKQSTQIKNMIDDCLLTNNFDYKCTVTIKNEDFPTKQYGELVLEKGNYRAIIINLGSGEGDNWWCVAFPPLCFLEGDKVIYKSKIWEIIKE